ncbi:MULTISPECIES: hypothetical protein [unclassified Jeotgalibaca]|uniref:hypothetical protein n=1 Tax=unclassified Jeotgalibaca TaxID=2621505 RepID=UPI003FD144D0
MKNSNSKKAFLIGLAATAAITAVATILMNEEETVDRVGAYLNRQRLKSKFKGNHRVMNVVETLSDNEIETLLSVFDRTGSWKDTIFDTFDDLRDKAVDYKDHVSKKFK